MLKEYLTVSSISGPLVVECLDRGGDAATVTAEARKARRLLEELNAT